MRKIDRQGAKISGRVTRADAVKSSDEAQNAERASGEKRLAGRAEALSRFYLSQPLAEKLAAAPDSRIGGERNQVRNRARAHFVHHPTSMHFDGFFSGAELGGDLLGHHPCDDQLQHIQFSGCQRPQPRRQCSKVSARLTRSCVLLQCRTNLVE